jgi:hypothetical protein
MFSLRKSIVGAIAALGMLAGSAASAGPLNVLYLSLDDSGSMTEVGFNLQVAGYLDVINNTSLLATDGSMAVGLSVFSTNNAEKFALQVLDPAGLAALKLVLEGLVFSGGWTNIGETVDQSTTAIIAGQATMDYDCGVINCVIDISTDGLPDSASGQVTALASAIDAITVAEALGITVNCLEIGSDLCSGWINAGSIWTADTIDQFGETLERKIREETTDVPAPAALFFIGFGLAGMGAARRRRSV